MGKSKNDGKSNNTDRNSTDTSNYEAESSINFLPTLKKKGVIRERNITMASRSSSRSISCRRKVPNEMAVLDGLEKVEFITPRKKISNR
jgi:hypothetical protein